MSGFTKGGSTTDLEPFNFTLNGQGAPVEIANPTNPPSPTAARSGAGAAQGCGGLADGVS